MKQIVLICLLLSSLLFAQKMETTKANDIISFVLINYDNLVIDCYTVEKPYIKVLSQKFEPYSNYEIELILQNGSICNIAEPVGYMMEVNRLIKAKTGIYFVD